ncbi:MULTISPECIES: hypothetical protein [unclassified Wenzhouxiangella]|uniref:hypothetical protein n=1 Tax=unclassified Wenzhouxiangella TaxID=2613841 RepID=UPI0011C04958|nr:MULTISPECIES: hypothetical protein [unclassified Wenzhouxiangella]
MLLILLIPAALAGIGEGLVGAIANSECLSNALPHASALLAELAPIAPAVALLLAGVTTLGFATWLIMRVVESN